MRTPSAVVMLAVLFPFSLGVRAAAPPPVSTRALLRGVRVAGRAEASVRIVRRDPLSGRATTARGRLTLELPCLARLDLEGGERLTLREDGGEWLQPGTRQLVRARGRSIGGALAWWSGLLDPGGGGVRERRSGSGRYALEVLGSGVDGEQTIELGADGLPRRLVLSPGTPDSVEYRLAEWRFRRPRGRAGFVLEPPAGYEIVDLQ